MKLKQAGLLVGAFAISQPLYAIAGTPVVFDILSAPEAVEQVANITQRPALDFDATSYETLISGAAPDIHSDQASVGRCSSTRTSMTDVREAVKRARAALDYMQDDKASAHLRRGVTALTCLDEPLDNEIVSEIFFLIGFLKHAEGKEPEAREAFRTASQFDKNLRWDNYFSPRENLYSKRPKSRL